MTISTKVKFINAEGTSVVFSLCFCSGGNCLGKQHRRACTWAMRTVTSQSNCRNICTSCLRSQSCCLCHLVQPFKTDAKFVVLMHPKERRKRSTTGTGRYTHLCIRGSLLIEGADLSENKVFNDLVNDKKFKPYVLFPGQESTNLSTDFHLFKTNHPNNQVPVIFIIDGSWHCAKKMMKINPTLAALPRISFNLDKPSAYSFRRQPEKYCLSTIEATHTLLTLFHANRFHTFFATSEHDNLLTVFNALVDFQKGFSGNRRRTKNYVEQEV